MSMSWCLKRTYFCKSGRLHVCECLLFQGIDRNSALRWTCCTIVSVEHIQLYWGCVRTHVNPGCFCGQQWSFWMVDKMYQFSGIPLEPLNHQVEATSVHDSSRVNVNTRCLTGLAWKVPNGEVKKKLHLRITRLYVPICFPSISEWITRKLL